MRARPSAAGSRAATASRRWASASSPKITTPTWWTTSPPSPAPTPPAPPAVSPSAPGGDDNTKAYSADETRDLLARAAGIEIGPDGVRLTGKDGGTLLDEADGRHLDYRTARRDPAMRRAVRAVYRGDLSGMPAAQRRSAMRQAWRLSGPYDRRRAIDTSPNRRYIPSGSIARSLKRRRDREGAARLLCDLYYEDAGAAGNVIRAGYPDDKRSAFVFMNRTKVQRYDKDVFGRKKDKDGNPVLLHRKGDAIVGDYVSARTGRPVHGPLPNPKGAAARSYLSMIWKPTNGVPSEQDVRDVCDVFRACDDDPETQARMMWDMCYGTGAATNPDGDVEFAKRILGGRKAHKRGVGLLNRFSAGKGSGQRGPHGRLSEADDHGGGAHLPRDGAGRRTPRQHRLHPPQARQGRTDA